MARARPSDALCLGRVRAHGPAAARRAAGQRGRACGEPAAADPLGRAARDALGPQSCLATGVVDACVRGAGEEAFAGGASRRSAAPAATSPGSPASSWPGRTLPPRQPPPAPERTAAGRLHAARRGAALRGARRAPARLLLEPRHARGAEGWTRSVAPSASSPSWASSRTATALSEVLFQDEDFFADRTRADAIAGGARGRSAALGWQAAAYADGRARRRARRACALLAASGCRGVHVPVPPGGPCPRRRCATRSSRPRRCCTRPGSAAASCSRSTRPTVAGRRAGRGAGRSRAP